MQRYPGTQIKTAVKYSAHTTIANIRRMAPLRVSAGVEPLDLPHTAGSALVHQGTIV